MLELLGKGEALSVAPPLVRLVLDVPVGADDDLLTWKRRNEKNVEDGHFRPLSTSF